MDYLDEQILELKRQQKKEKYQSLETGFYIRDELLDFERVLHCKYLSAVQECQDQELKSKFQSCASQHLQNYNTLLTHLR